MGRFFAAAWVAPPRGGPIETRIIRRREGDLRSRAQRTALGIAALLGLAICALRLVRIGQVWWHQGSALADLHRAHAVSHAGWSFPGRIETAAVPVPSGAREDGVRSAEWPRLLAEARARGYREHCPSPRRGEYCPSSRTLNPRHGGTLEPLVMGWLVGATGELREHLPLEKAPRHLVDAILAAEDRDFYSHHGVDLLAAARAALSNVRGGGYRQGASTLSMQVARTFAGRREKTLGRKLGEMVMALALDHRLGKRGVLQAYLDIPFLGVANGVSVCGFQAAARHFFGTDAQDLTLAQAATLVALLPAPLLLDPARHPQRVLERRNQILEAMAAHFGYDVREALEAPLHLVARAGLPQRFPSYLSATRAWLEQRLDAATLYDRGLVATAAVDVPAQAATEALLRERTRFADARLVGADGPLQSAAVLLDEHTGRLRAVWGGLEDDAGFNRATQARRPPGSAFKPLVYALAFDAPPAADGLPRFTSSTVLANEPHVFDTPQGDWAPRNAEPDAPRSASLASALVTSQNAATARLLQGLGGPDPLVELAARLGFDTRRFPSELGLALGQAEVSVVEMAQLAASIANGGFRVFATPVLTARDLTGRSWFRPPTRGARVLSASAAALTRELMRLVVRNGTGQSVRGAAGEAGYRGEVMGKTGTSELARDVWFVGATPQWASALWMGRDRPAALGAMASDLAAPLWGWWMARLSALGGDSRAFPADPEIERARICTETGLLAGPDCPALTAPFLPGTAPAHACDARHARHERADDGAASPWEREAVPASAGALGHGDPPRD